MTSPLERLLRKGLTFVMDGYPFTTKAYPRLEFPSSWGHAVILEAAREYPLIRNTFSLSTIEIEFLINGHCITSQG